MMVVMKGKEVKYITRNASTLPDLYPGPIEWKSSTVVTDGIYDYWTGTHNDAYTALVSGNKNAWYYDRNKITNNKKGFFGGLANGINIHAGGDANISTDEALSWSQGCQIIWYADYVNFGKNVGFLKNSAEPIKGNTSGHMAALGVDHTLHINVLYIIDRTFMPDSYYGKFLPEKPKK